MVGIAQNVTDLERQLQTITLERDRLQRDKEHLTTVNTIQAESIRILQFERDRYFAASESIGQLCESLADGLVAGVKKWQDAKPSRTTPGADVSSRVVQAAAPKHSMADHASSHRFSKTAGGAETPDPKLASAAAPSIEEAIAKLHEVSGKPPHVSANLLPKVDPK